MNKWQKRIILGGFALLILMGLFPPWLHSFELIEDNHVLHFEHSVGYSFLLSPPFPGENAKNGIVREISQGDLMVFSNGAEAKDFWDKEGDKFVDAFWTPHIDIERLLIQWLLVIFIVAGGFLILKDKA